MHYSTPSPLSRWQAPATTSRGLVPHARTNRGRRASSSGERGGLCLRSFNPDRLHDAHAIRHAHVGQGSTPASGDVPVSWSRGARSSSGPGAM